MNDLRDQTTRKLIADCNIGGLLLWRTEELVLTTGYLPLWGISICLYPLIGTPIIYIPELEPRDRLPEGFEIKTFPWGILDCKDPWAELYASLRKDIENQQGDQKALGFVLHSGQTSPAQMSGESAPFPNDFKEKLKYLSYQGYKDISNDFQKLFLLKQKIEIERISLANKIAGIGIQTFYDNLIPGLTEADVAGKVEASIQSQMGKNGVIYAKAWPLIMSGMNTAYGGIFNRTTGKVLETGELVMIEMAVCVNGYWCDITRTGSTGNIDTELNEIYDVVLEAQNRAITAIEPGVKGSDIDKISRDYITEMGYGDYYNHALGHHVGFRYHDPGMGLSPNSNLILKQGMIVTVEPGIYAKKIGGGCRIEDNVLVTENGCRILSNFNKGLT